MQIFVSVNFGCEREMSLWLWFGDLPSTVRLNDEADCTVTMVLLDPVKPTWNF